MNKASERQARYDEKATRRFGFKLNLGTDSEIIDRLESTKNMQGYIKRLIRRDIEMEQGLKRQYAIAKMSIKEINEALEKGDFDYKPVFKSSSPRAIIEKLRELNASDDEYSIDEYTLNENDDYVEGFGYDTPSNFIKLMA